MGIYDRDYYRQARPSRSMPGPRTVVGALILANVVVYVVEWVLLPLLHGDLALSQHFERLFHASVGTLTSPLQWWQFITYGFLHAQQPQHIIFNMLGLFFLGRDVEELYGPKEFLRLYLVLLVFGSLVWAAAGKLQGAPELSSVVGASGALAGIVVLYALNFPRRTLLLFFVLPVPAWFVGILVVGMDIHGAVARPEGSRIAYAVHLAGAAFALLYYGLGWNFGRLWPKSFSFSLRWLRPRPKLRVRSPDDEVGQPEGNLTEEVDRILEKISREGESSLTRKERRTLETASRRYQKRRQDTDDRVR
jgi:membrane associated rhomboid family serine protease